jgi:bacillithiol biosynthesis cysteine-adding enzyme BshC
VSDARVVTQALGGSPLARAVQEGRLPGELALRVPRTVEDWRAHADAVRTRTDASWHSRIAPAISASPGSEAASRLERVVKAGGVVVTTGQQAALFGGPLYTLAKAITAAALADRLEQQLGVPAAPLFWAATDDADFVEAATAWVADASGLHELRIAAAPPAGTMLSATGLTREDARGFAKVLRAACGSAVGADVVEQAVAAFSPPATVGSAYVTLLRAILEPLGIGVLDSSHAAYREAARPVLAESLERAADLSAALAENASAIRAAGFEPQVEDDRGLSLVFRVAGGTKRRIALDAAGKRAGSRGDLSPNVLLRPVVEREILPTVAYLGGPGEVAYFIQSNVVARALGRSDLVALPRWSATIIEPYVERTLRRLGADWRELENVHALEKRVATESLPADVSAEWKRLRESVRASMGSFGAAVRRADLLPAVVVQGLERQLDHKLSRGERRLLAAAKRRDARARQDIAIASAALFPGGKRQERVLNFIPMLARNGQPLVEAMRTAAAEHVATLMEATARREPVAAL